MRLGYGVRAKVKGSGTVADTQRNQRRREYCRQVSGLSDASDVGTLKVQNPSQIPFSRTAATTGRPKHAIATGHQSRMLDPQILLADKLSPALLILYAFFARFPFFQYTCRISLEIITALSFAHRPFHYDRFSAFRTEQSEYRKST